MHICGDYKVTINNAAKLDAFPLPRIGDLFASLTGGKKFSKLDLAHAYQQIPLDEDSIKLVVINTSKGLFHYNRLPFGVSSDPAIFQRIIENILQGIDHVCIYLDDILITGKDDADHLQTLETVLTCLETAGLRLRREKCGFMLPSVEYLGHRISAEKTTAIADALPPRDVSQLCLFLGMVNYYAKFLPSLSSTLAPLYGPLEKKTSWSWGKEQEAAFKTRLLRFLFQYRIAPHSTTGVPPAELLLGRRPRSHLDLLRPDLKSKVHTSQYRQKAGHDRKAKPRGFKVGDSVFARNFSELLDTGPPLDSRDRSRNNRAGLVPH